MPRRARVIKREVPPDPKFGSRTLTRFMNKLMLNGKKSLAERIVYGALESIIKGDRKQSLAMRWLIAAARGRGGKSMADKLASELLDASNNTGATIRKRDETHRMAEANKAFSHYRW